MNASAQALAREVDVQSKIRKVRTFGRVARVACAAIFGFGSVATIFMLGVSVIGVSVPGSVIDSGWTQQMKMWALPAAGLMLALALAAVYLLYLIFGDLARGAIYTAVNVRRVRNIGLIWLLSAVITVLLPAYWSVLYEFVFDNPIPREPANWFSLSQTLSSFITAGLILVISWIMDIGLYEKDHADELQRDADLVI